MEIVSKSRSKENKLTYVHLIALYRDDFNDLDDELGDTRPTQSTSRFKTRLLRHGVVLSKLQASESLSPQPTLQRQIGQML